MAMIKLFCQNLVDIGIVLTTSFGNFFESTIVAIIIVASVATLADENAFIQQSA